MKRLNVGSGIVVLFSLSLAGAVFAQAGIKEMPPGKWWTQRRLINELQLRAEQQARIEAQWLQSRRGLIELKAELEQRQLDLAELLNNDSVEENAALKAFDAVQEARMNLERSTFLMRLRIKNTLSREQQQRLEIISERLRQQRGKVADAQGAPGLQPVRK